MREWNFAPRKRNLKKKIPKRLLALNPYPKKFRSDIYPMHKGSPRTPNPPLFAMLMTGILPSETLLLVEGLSFLKTRRLLNFPLFTEVIFLCEFHRHAHSKALREKAEGAKHLGSKGEDKFRTRRGRTRRRSAWFPAWGRSGYLTLITISLSESRHSSDQNCRSNRSSHKF